MEKPDNRVRFPSIPSLVPNRPPVAAPRPVAPSPKRLGRLRDWLTWRRVVIFGLIKIVALVCLTAAFGAGYLYGTRSAEHFDPYGADLCVVTPNMMSFEVMAQRNVVWKAWTKPNDALLQKDEGKIAAMIALIVLPPDAESYAPFVKALVMKSNLVDEGVLTNLAAQEDPVDRAMALRRFLASDMAASELMRQVLCDGHRVSLFLAGRPIPPERLPDGRVP